MSQEQIPVWGVITFPGALLANAREFLDCNCCPVFDIGYDTIQKYMRKHNLRMSKVARDIFNSSGSGFKAKKSAVNDGLRIYRIKVSSLGFNKPVTREQIIEKASQYGLTPIDTPRTWAIPLRSWYKEDGKITLFGTVHYGDVIKKTPMELMFTLGYSEEHGKYLSVRNATGNMLFQPDETIVLEGKH